MRSTRILVALVLAAAVSAVLAADALMLRPGRWEMTVQLDFGNRKLPEGMPLAAPMKEVSCLTKENLAKHRALIPPPDASCKISDYKSSGKEISYVVQCADMAMDFKAILESPDAFSAVSTSRGKDPNQALVMKMSGKRIGDVCSAQELAEANQEE
jgi:Protein of unknown function (DUF3617)